MARGFLVVRPAPPTSSPAAVDAVRVGAAPWRTAAPTEHEIPGKAAFLRAQGSDNDHDLGLFALGPDAAGPQRNRVGLHHPAWEVGTLGELVETGELLDARRALTGRTDFLTAKSVHGVDPDGNEFEVMWRTPRSDWPAPEENQKPLPLDLRSAIDRWGPDLRTGAAAGSVT